jgi:hypothetical protein
LHVANVNTGICSLADHGVLSRPPGRNASFKLHFDALPHIRSDVVIVMKWERYFHRTNE